MLNCLMYDTQQIEEQQSKYDLQIEQCTDLSKKLDATQVSNTH